jgi:hypothetical protein
VGKAAGKTHPEGTATDAQKEVAGNIEGARKGSSKSKQKAKKAPSVGKSAGAATDAQKEIGGNLGDAQQRDIRLSLEKEIIAIDLHTGGYEEFVVMDRISVTKQTVLLVTEAKRCSLGEGLKQCLLALRDMYDNNMRCDIQLILTAVQAVRTTSSDAPTRTSRNWWMCFV